MNIYHSRLDHDFRVWSSQLNYSLFGNSAGRTTAGPRRKGGKEPPPRTLADERAANWSSIHLKEAQKRMYAQPYDERLFAISYWMWTEYSHQSLDERGHGHYLVGRDS